MPLRRVAQSSFFDPEFLVADCLSPGSVPWLFRKHRSLLFPSWLFRGWRGERRTGRPAWPAPILMTLLLLRWSEEGMSRLASTRRARTDLVWRAALGLSLVAPSPDEKTLREFESFLRQRDPLTGVPRYLLFHEHVVRLCLTHGVVGSDATWAVDSTPMWCFGAVLDTLRLLGDGTRMLLRSFARLSGGSIDALAAELDVLHVLAKSTKGHFRIDWRDADARNQVTEQLAQGTLRVSRYVQRNVEMVRRNKRKGLLRRCRHLLRVVADDLETDENGRLCIARRVAKDRMISMTDPQARHGRKSRSRTFNGYKLHVLGDVVSGLITSLTVTPGNHHDGSVAHRLIGRANKAVDDIEQVLGDTAYGGAKLRYMVRRELEIDMLAPPQPLPRRPGRLGRQDMDFDPQEQTLTCKAGHRGKRAGFSRNSEYETRVAVIRWDKRTCDACEFSKRCRGKRRGGQRVLLHPYEQQLRESRRRWAVEDVRTRYRTRSQCERLVHRQVRHGARRARAFGLANANLQAHFIAATCNLALLAKALAEQDHQAQCAAA